MFKKRELLQFSRDRLAVSLLSAFLLSMLLLVIITILNIHVSDVQLPARYTGYGLTNIYRDRWYSLLSFGLFGLLVGGVNGYLIIKLYSIRKGLALGFATTSLFIGIIALIIATAVFRLAALSL
jgi:phosphotransferase system  glucose/maltose/N-acetylglucosamine-specific IIC component